MTELYAHTPNEKGKWHLLEAHLIETAKAACTFAKAFRCENAAFVLGLFHDLGKADYDFQDYLRACYEGKHMESIPHAVCGAAYLWKILLRQKSRDASMAMSALGHHGGLSAERLAATEGGFTERLYNARSQARKERGR